MGLLLWLVAFDWRTCLAMLTVSAVRLFLSKTSVPFPGARSATSIHPLTPGACVRRARRRGVKAASRGVRRLLCKAVSYACHQLSRYVMLG
eukprot:6192083-Pleurochrysis_carterae.AAC.1